MKIPGVLSILSSIVLSLPATAVPANDLFCRGKYEFKDDRYGEAIVSFSQAIRANPRFSEAYFYRGFTHHFKQRYPEAIANYNQALALGSRYSAEILQNRASALADFGDYKQALEDIKLALQYKPNDSDLLKALAFSFLKLGSRKSAIAALEKLARTYFQEGSGDDYLETRDLIKKVRAGGTFQYSLRFNHDLPERICP